MNYLEVADKATKIGTVVAIALFLIVCIFSSTGRKIEQQWHTETEIATETTVETTTEAGKTEYIAASTDNNDLGVFRITAYCPCKKCNGEWSDGITSTGKTAKSNHTIAVDPDVIPYGSHVIVNGKEYVAEDCGGTVKGKTIDIFFDTHEEALEFGVQYANVQLKGSD